MINPYNGQTMQQHNVDKFDELCVDPDRFFTIGGSAVARLIPIMEVLYLEQRIDGDKMRDAAQTIESVIKHVIE